MQQKIKGIDSGCFDLEGHHQLRRLKMRVIRESEVGRDQCM